MTDDRAIAENDLLDATVDALIECVGLLPPRGAEQFWKAWRTHPYLDQFLERDERLALLTEERKPSRMREFPGDPLPMTDLRKIAEAAWAGIEAGYDEEEEDQRHHDGQAFAETFDPPTVLALLDVVEAARTLFHPDAGMWDSPRMVSLGVALAALDTKEEK